MPDNSTFESFVSNYQDLVFTTAIRLLQNPSDAEDVAQEVFLRAYKEFHKLQDNPAAGGWLRCVARNLCLNHLTRYRARWRFFTDVFHPDDDSSESLDVIIPHDLNPAGPTDMQAMVQEALLSLPTKQRVPLVLYHYEDLSYQEIADLMKIALSQVKTDIHRGREALKEKILRLRGQSDLGIFPRAPQPQDADLSTDFHHRARQGRLATRALSLMGIKTPQIP